MKIVSALSFLILLTQWTFAQEREIKKMDHKKRHAVAHDLIEKGGHYGAVDHLEELVKDHPNEVAYQNKLAFAYYKSRDYKKSEELYKEVLAKEGKVLTDAQFYFARSLQYNGKYEEAWEQFKEFSEARYRERKGERLRYAAKELMLSCEYAMSHIDKKNEVVLSHLGDNINSSYSEFSPRLKNDCTMVYSSLQSDSVITVEYGEIHYNHVKMYSSSVNAETNEWSEPTELNINRKFESAANGSYSPDGKVFYFTRCQPSRSGEMRCRIFKSNVSETGELSKPKVLPRSINTPGYTATMPYYGSFKEGKRNLSGLYFVSNYKRGLGGMDIWFAPEKRDGSLSKPFNCGRSINTYGDEVSPFYDSETGILYFSSDFHPGFGGQDVFYSQGAGNKWGAVKNIGQPINSSTDDTYYTLGHNKFHGFLSSNRPGGYALKSETCCDDIYSFKYKEPAILTVNLYTDTTYKTKDSNPIFVFKGLIKDEDDTTSYSVVSLADFDSVGTSNEPVILSLLNISSKLDSFYSIEPNKEYLVRPTVPKGYVQPSIKLITSDLDNITSKSDNGDTLYRLVKTEGVKLYTLDIPLMKIVDNKVAHQDTVSEQTTLVKAFVSLKYKLADTVQVDTSLTQKIVKRGIRSMDLKLNFKFEFNAADLRGKELTRLDSIVEILVNNKNIKAELSTHTDNIGSDAYNMSLSNRRASFMATYLIKKGVPKVRITAIGHGETKPIAPNQNADGTDNPEGRSINRRTEVRFFY